MRAWIVAAAAIAAFSSGAARADTHYGAVHAQPYFSFGIGYPGIGYPYYPYWGGYRPYYYPWGPTFGFGVTVAPQPVHSHDHEAQPSSQQQGFKLYVYPAGGQSDAQLSEDRYQCHVWATNQTGYDPTQGAGKREDAEGYTRAFTACMEGRNYVVK
jgi:hypothetical protein